MRYEIKEITDNVQKWVFKYKTFEFFDFKIIGKIQDNMKLMMEIGYGL